MFWYEGFLRILNMSLTASVIIIFVLLCRLLLKKAPKIYSYILWSAVIFRLLCPISIAAPISLMVLVQAPVVKLNEDSLWTMQNGEIKNSFFDLQVTEEKDIILDPQVADEQFTNTPKAETTGGNDSLSTFPRPSNSLSPSFLNTTLTWMTWVWMLGALAMMGNGAISYFKLRKKLSEAIRTEENIYISDYIPGPFVIGIIKPRIYLPSTLEKEAYKYIIYHEKYHIHRGDVLYKMLAYFALCIHWFNPLVWLAFGLFVKDMEMSCDEVVIKKFGDSIRADYAASVLEFSTGQKRVIGVPLAFGEGELTGRIKNISEWKKPTVTVCVIATLLCVCAVVFCVLNPKGANDLSTEHEANLADENDVTGENEVGGKIVPEQEKNSETNENLTSEAMNASVMETIQNIDRIIDLSEENLREGFKPVKLTYVDNISVNWNYYSEEPWLTTVRRDALAQAAMKELYTLTGYQVEECVYTTDGRSRFIFGKSEENIRKCIAFYSRDYGFALAGDSVPYMGFANARRVHYSDVQQMDSPYNKPEYSGHALIPMWFLEHSGVYGGESITGFDAVNLEDTVYTHIQLNFDGGYYMVVMDEAIESVHEVSGPYFE